MAKKRDDIQTSDIAQAQQWKTGSDVSEAMIKAGTKGYKTYTKEGKVKKEYKPGLRARLRAGARAAWVGKTRSMYTDDTTTPAKILRLMGHQNAATWYDRFFAKQHAKEKSGRAAGREDAGGESKMGTVVQGMSSGFRGLNKKLDIIASVTMDTREDVRDIKSLIMPKNFDVKMGKKAGKQGVTFNPLAPKEKQFLLRDKDGKVGGEPGKRIKENAINKAAFQTAMLALKIQKKDEARGELRNKYGYKDVKEAYGKESEVEVLRKEMHERFDKLGEPEEKEGWLSKIGDLIGGLWSKITDFFKNPLAILGGLAALMPLAGMLAKGSLVGLAGYLGYELGTWLNEKFKLDEKINDAIQTAMGWFGKGNEAKVRAADKAAVDAKNVELAKINKQLEGTGYRKQEMKISEDGTTYSGGGYVDAKGNKVLEKDLPPNVKRQLGMDVGPVSAEPDARRGPSSRGGARGARSPEAAAPPPPTPSPPPSTGSLKKPTRGKDGLLMPDATIKDIILKAADRVGVEQGIMMAMAKQESAFNPSAKAKTSSATGLYQFLDSTWGDMVSKYSKQYPELLKGRLDPMANAIAGALFIKENADILRKAGLPVDGTSIYAAHFLGPGGARKLFSADANADAAALMPKPAAANKFIFYKKDGTPRTVGEVQQVLFEKVGQYADAYTDKLQSERSETMLASNAPAPSAAPAPSSTGGSVAPASSSSASTIDNGSRALTAANAPAGGGGVVVGPTVVNNNTNNTVGKKPMGKADVVSRDDALVRTASRDSRARPALA